MTLPHIFGHFKDFDKFFVGFDEQYNRLQQFHEDAAKTPNYPPYNIRKTGDNSYTIEIAVAGFDQSEIDIEIDSSKRKLIVRGNASHDNDTNSYVFKGIATRSFVRSFVIDDMIEVKDAELVNGMLRIVLERNIPEEKKPKKVLIKTKGQRQALFEDVK